MAALNVYLNFDGQCEEAFNFYRRIFGGEFMQGISRFGDMPPGDDMPSLPEEVADQVLHVALPVMGSILMGSDAPSAMGIPPVTAGTNMSIVLSPDSRAETERIFSALAEGGEVTMALHDAFWGSYFGTCTDRFGIQWMLDYAESAPEN